MSDTPDVDAGRTRRRRRYAMLGWLRDRTSRAAGKVCMHAAGVGVTVGATAAGVTHVGGVTRCGSPWSCPVCSPTIGERRAIEIDAAIAAWRAMGGHVFLVTATLAHNHGDRLGDLLDMLQGSWSRTFRWGNGVSPPWYGGQCRAVEITHGSNGFHPHIHSLVFVEAGWDSSLDAIRQELVDMRRDWGESVHLYGGTTSVLYASSPGWDVRPVVDADVIGSYLNKVEGGWGAGLELARQDLKGKGTTPSMLLDAATAGDTRAATLYDIYERATAGRKRIVSTPGLFKRCQVEVLDDDDAAEAAPVDELVFIVSVPASCWVRMLRSGHAARLLDDVGDVALKRGAWPWPPEWIVKPPG